MYVYTIACVAAVTTLFQHLIQTYNFSIVSRHFRLYIQTYWPHFGLLVLENLVTRSVEFHTKKKMHKKLPLKMQLFHFANNHFYRWMQMFFLFHRLRVLHVTCKLLPTNIMVCSCAMLSCYVNWLQITFCSCANETGFSPSCDRSCVKMADHFASKRHIH